MSSTKEAYAEIFEGYTPGAVAFARADKTVHGTSCGGSGIPYRHVRQHG